MPKIEVDLVPIKTGSIYPDPFKKMADARIRQALGDAVGLTQFGVSLTRLPPGAATAHRHWHETEDELVFILSGELILIEDDGEECLSAGDAAAFKAGVANGHHMVNRSSCDALILEVGTRAANECAHYPDVDLVYEKSDGIIQFSDKTGKPYT